MTEECLSCDFYNSDYGYACPFIDSDYDYDNYDYDYDCTCPFIDKE